MQNLIRVLLMCALAFTCIVTTDSSQTESEQNSIEAVPTSGNMWNNCYVDIRKCVQNADFTRGRIVTQCAIVGTVSVQEREFVVVAVESVIGGMAAPRGERRLALLSFQAKPESYQVEFDIAIQSGAITEPLWCDSSRIYLAGRTRGVPQKTRGEKHNGNVIEFGTRDGRLDFELLDVFAYGSSGGVDDFVPTRAAREAERVAWDTK